MNGVAGLISQPGIYKVLAIGSLLNTGHSIYQYYMPVYAHSIGLSASAIGVILATYAAAQFVVRLALLRLIKRFTEGKVLDSAFIVGAASLILAPFVSGTAPLASISFALGLGMGCGGPIIMMTMFTNSPVGRRHERVSSFPLILLNNHRLQAGGWGCGLTVRIRGFSVCGVMLLTLYTLSTLYHSTRGRVKVVFRKLDHCSIYLLMAGTYTPFTLVTLRGAWGWSLFGVIWGLAAFGIVQEACFGKGSRIISLIIYVVMGWLGAIALNSLCEALTPSGFAWLAAGGLLYTVGIILYLLDETLVHGHGIWHLFVLGGSTSRDVLRRLLSLRP